MAESDKDKIEKLDELKKNVEEAHEYFADNITRYEKFMEFVFKSSLNDAERATLKDQGKPDLEFNITESQVNAVKGEFEEQEPSAKLRIADGIPTSMFTPQLIQTMEVLEAHFRSIMSDNKTASTLYKVRSEQLGGGYSVIKVYTDYVSPMSFQQNICMGKPVDPTLCFFDPLANEPHKGDGGFCGELFPLTRDQFERKFGSKATEKMRFTRPMGETFAGFSWSFKNEKKEIILLCDYYEKKFKAERICQLSNGHVILKKEYQKLLKQWDELGILEQVPVVVEERETMLESIVRYVLCESEILKVEETDFAYLPLIFVDGNSVNLKQGGAYSQMTKPYSYQTEGMQRLKNYAGQSMGNELENLVQHKFIVAIESIPTDYQGAYQNVQKADTLVYNHFLDTNNPTVILPPPREVMRPPIPPEIFQTFTACDGMMKTILGAYDGADSMSSGAVSGISFARQSMKSNKASTPFNVGYIQALNRFFQIVLDLIPKYYKTPRSLPILLPDGKHEYVEINNEGALSMNYDPNFLGVSVKAGVNFEIQKEVALQTLVSLSQSMPNFAQFFGQKGLPTLLDNLSIRGADALKQKAAEYEQEQAQVAKQQQQLQQQQMQQQMQQIAMQNAQMQKELQAPSANSVAQFMVEEKSKADAATIAIKQRDSETKFLEAISKIRTDKIDTELKAAQIDAENTRSTVDAMINLATAFNKGNDHMSV